MTTLQILQVLMDKGLLSETDSYTVIRGRESGAISIHLPHPLIISEMNEAEKAQLAGRLLRVYRPETPILCISSNGNILKMSIEEFNNQPWQENDIFFFDGRKATALPVTPFSLASIEKTVKRLLAPGGCPWDRAQDHRSLRTYFLQEVYEVIDAIDKNDMVNLEEELGDVLLQIVFHASLAEEEGYFTMQDVVDGITDKMVRRHPFVFGNMTVEETKSVLGDWEKRKRLEKNRKYLLSGVSRDLPSLLLACIIQKKVSSNGGENIFFAEDIHKEIRDVVSRILSEGTAQDKESQIGEFLLVVDRVISQEGIEPELALHKACIQYMDRWHQFEIELEHQGKRLLDLTSDETLTYWQAFSQKH